MDLQPKKRQAIVSIEPMERKSKKIFIISSLALVFAAGLMVFSISKDKKPGEGIFQAATAPVASFFSGLGFWSREKIEFVSSIGSLKRENEELFEENLRLKAKVANLGDVKKENDELRRQISLAPQGKYELEAARVIGSEIGGRMEKIYIDKGQEHGIESQMAVVVGEGVLIGKVAEAHRKTSQVELLIGSDSRVNVEILESGARGIAVGRYDTSVVLDMIKQTVQVNKGDTVITSGLGGGLPRGLFVGHVQDAYASPDQLFQQASLVLPVKFDGLRIVWVAKEGK